MTKSPAEIEREIEATRADIGRTLDEIRARLSPGEILDQVLGMSRTGPALMAKSATTLLKDQPIPAALIGAGLFMLVNNRTRAKRDYTRSREAEYRYRSGYGASGRRSYGVQAGFADTGTEYFEAEPLDPYQEQSARESGRSSTTGSSTTAAARQKVSQMTETVSNKAGAVTEQARAAANRVSENISQKAQQLRERGTEMSGRVNERLSAAREQARGYATQIRSRASDDFTRAQTATKDFVQEYPLVAGALVAAVGAVIGSLIPTTRRERELMGAHSEQLKEAARGALAQGKEAVSHIADAAINQGREEARTLTERTQQNFQGQGNGQPAIH